MLVSKVLNTQLQLVQTLGERNNLDVVLNATSLELLAEVEREGDFGLGALGGVEVEEVLGGVSGSLLHETLQLRS